MILNSVILLTISASLIALHSDSTESKDVSKESKWLVSASVLASGDYVLLLSLMQLSFDRIMTCNTFPVVLDMQVYTSLLLTCFCMVRLFASGEGSILKEDMEG